MSDTSWEEFAAGDITSADLTAGLPDGLAADITPSIDAAATDAWQAEHATSWADWNADIAGDAASNAAAEVAYAEDLYAAGWDEAGDAALARAQISADTATAHDGTAADYYDTAAGEYGSAADNLGTAASYTEDYSSSSSYDATSYDTTSYDTTSYDTTSYDTTSYDTTSYDTAAVDTSSYDTSSYDAGTE